MYILLWPVPGHSFVFSRWHGLFLDAFMHLRWPKYSTFLVYIPSLFVLNNSTQRSV